MISHVSCGGKQNIVYKGVKTFPIIRVLKTLKRSPKEKVVQRGQYLLALDLDYLRSIHGLDLVRLEHFLTVENHFLQKTMSNPATISRALKYIPELRQHVEELRRRKQGLETKINAITHDQQKQVRKNKEAPWMGCSSCAVNWLRENEALLQLTSNDTFKLKFSQILRSLDEDELLVKTVSTFQSFDGRHFFTLLVQV